MTGRFVDFYSEYTPLRKNGGDWRGACPIHGGDNPLNFSVKPDTGEWFCHSQCDCGGDVFAFIESVKQIGFSEAVDFVGKWAGTPSQMVTPKSTDPGRIVATYDYVDASGTLVYQVLRIEPGPQGERKTFRQRRPNGQGGWISNLQGVSRVLYRLPEVLAAIKAGKPIAIVEGEKCADELWDLGVPATTNAMGSEKWDQSYVETLTGASLYILPDNDPPDKRGIKDGTNTGPGQRHAVMVAKAMHGHAKSIRIVTLPGLPVKGDVYDWIEAGGTRAQLMEIMEGTAEWVPVAVEKPAYVVAAAPVEFTEWPEITPFETVDAIEFPIEALPERVRTYAREVSASLKVPLDAVGMTMIGAVSAAQRGRCFVQVGDTHAEALLFHMAIIAPPASRKTAILDAAADPVRNAQFRLIKQVRDENKTIAAKFEVDSSIAADLKKKIAHAKDKYSRQDMAAELVELTNKIAPPKTEPQLIADDVTPEGLASLMSRQDDCAIAVLSDEGSFFDNVAGRYNKGKANTNLVCKSYDGSPATVNRQNQEGKTLYLHRPSLSVVMMVQPGVIQGMAKGSTDFDERGFFARLTYSFPEFTIDDEYSRIKVDADAQRRYTELINELVDIPLPASEDARERWRLNLTGDALDEWAVNYSETQRRMRDGGDLAWCREWAGKLAGKAARAAGLFHLIECVSDFIEAKSTPLYSAVEMAARTPISVRNVAAGWALAEYMIPQAFKTFGEMRVDPVQQLAERVIKWTKRGDHAQFTTRDCQRGNKPASSENVKAALIMLAEHGYIRQSGQLWVSNPKIL
jgi:putative DNA primase/helicase